jgi:glyoxylase-like metal-dependent hydrolase (beta-lactamase superfamily II)
MRDEKHRSEIFSDFNNHDRFKYPENIVRVTAGRGGEALLIFTRTKVVLYDTGMAYCGDALISNIEKTLKDRERENIDYVLISHTHYDHIGALPFVVKRWPKTHVVGSQKAQNVFMSDNAKSLIKKLGEVASENYSHGESEIPKEGFRVDLVLADGDEIILDESKIKALSTKGHTDCSMTYILLPDNIMFASESTGVLRGKDYMHTAILKSFEESIKSAEKCRDYRPNMLISPHYGLIPKEYIEKYFNLYIKEANEEKNLILECKKKGMSFEEIEKAHENKYWCRERASAQPKAAYLENRKHTINCITKEFLENDKKD